jgi:hypothetical protein
MAVAAAFETDGRRFPEYRSAAPKNGRILDLVGLRFAATPLALDNSASSADIEEMRSHLLVQTRQLDFIFECHTLTRGKSFHKAS